MAEDVNSPAARWRADHPGGSEEPEPLSRLDYLLSALAIEDTADEWWEKKHPGIPRYKSPQIAKIRAEVARLKALERQQRVQS